jgi:hypothetical protein
VPEQDATGATGPVVLHLCLDPGDPPCGTVRLGDHQTDTSFAGWVELMAAITTLRSAPSGAAPPV